MSNYHLLTVIIPAFNEEEGIGKVLAQLTSELPEAQVIVVDDGSTDRTAAEASGHSSVRVIRHAFNRGYGASLRTGMETAEREYVAWFDADNEHRTTDLQSMFELIRRDRLVAVIGQRENQSVSIVRAAGKLFIRSLGRTFDLKVGSDLNCGLRIFRTEVITRYLSLLPDRYSASLTTTMLMVERHYPIAFFRVRTAKRIGVSKVRLKDGLSAISKLIRLIMLFAPMRIFFRLGVLLIVIGLTYGTYIAITEHLGFPIAGMLVVLFGGLLSMLGLVADQISQFWLSQLAARPLQHRVSPDKQAD
ncbi:glycosyltransferase family 2 protein [Bradyrhizobium sp. AUGA SZCCT0240]|uniref:glycosyltransferase family 2 protein n=1 Tax=Bradyrhizobium sp. AUGA SZCCT0240 TaxID=2807669 RepID=UPI001BA53A51|nr:glycosyltransferase family 2 protein [Bradyrhizobium sp. AUGA SZCCT0240]MBR1257954.1 glycosyltransferase family 2 protein [Bradyrhizobium sp. AUGA SZCCT0240]